jgi:hypothetical protein
MALELPSPHHHHCRSGLRSPGPRTGTLALMVLALLLVSHMPSCSQSVSSAYYVAKSGSDANPGTEAQPFLTIARGLTVLEPGKTLYIKAGLYTEGLDNDVPGGSSWDLPVTISAYPGDSVCLKPPAGSVRVFNPQGSSRCYIVLNRLVLDGANCKYDVVKIDQANGSFAHHIRLQECEVRNSPGDCGILVTVNADYCEFIRCNVHHNGRTNQKHGMYIGADHTLVDGCLVHDNSGWGIHILQWGALEDSCHDNIARNNICFNNSTSGSGCGLGIYSGANNIAYNNIIWGNERGIGVGYGSTNAMVYNNTIYGNWGADYQGIMIAGAQRKDSDVTSGTVIRNNIIIVTSGMAITDGGRNTVADHNLMSDSGFVNAAAHDFRLLASSAAVNAGMTLSSFSTDRNGTPRPQGSAWDIGAYEFTPDLYSDEERHGR